jgi:hypothetical protein
MVSRLKLSSKYNKSSNFNENITIDAKHNEMINQFRSQKDSVPQLKEELKKFVSEYNNRDNTRKNDIEYILYRDNLREKINEMKEKINSIIKDDDVNKYYLDVGTLLHNYYENIELSKNVHSNSEKFEENLVNYDEILSDYDEEDEIDQDEEINISSKANKNKKEIKSVLNFFNSTKNDIKNENVDENNNSLPKKESNSSKSNLLNENNQNSGNYTSMKISDFVKEESTFKKKDILDEYLQKIDPNYISRIKFDINTFKCSKCSLEMTLYPSDGIQICETCGIQENIFIESDKPSFKDPPMEVCYFTYKRINHYNEFYKRQKVVLMSIFNIINKIFLFLIIFNKLIII